MRLLSGRPSMTWPQLPFHLHKTIQKSKTKMKRYKNTGRQNEGITISATSSFPSAPTWNNAGVYQIAILAHQFLWKGSFEHFLSTFLVFFYAFLSAFLGTFLSTFFRTLKSFKVTQNLPSNMEQCRGLSYCNSCAPNALKRLNLKLHQNGFNLKSLRFYTHTIW